MNRIDLQARIGTRTDNIWGPASKAALVRTFTSPAAPAITAAQLQAMATRLGCTLAQLRAVASVESGRSAFDDQGRPKILFERHVFHELTSGRYSISPWSNPQWGGYGEPSWDKLCCAAGQDPAAAFASASWGRFQVLGKWWSQLGFSSSFDLAISTAASELAHYELLARYIEWKLLKPALRALSRDPETCRTFAHGYNGEAYERNAYHRKLAAAL